MADQKIRKFFPFRMQDREQAVHIFHQIFASALAEISIHPSARNRLSVPQMIVGRCKKSIFRQIFHKAVIQQAVFGHTVCNLDDPAYRHAVLRSGCPNKNPLTVHAGIKIKFLFHDLHTAPPFPFYTASCQISRKCDALPASTNRCHTLCI